MHVSQLLPLFASLGTALTIQERQSLPSGVQLAEVTYVGAGCPANATAKTTPTALAVATTVPIPKLIYEARSGVDNTRVALTRQSCSTLIKLTHPAGWQFSVAKADYYGLVTLPQGSEAFSVSTYGYTGSSTTQSKQYYFDGPFDGLYFRNDRWATVASQPWSPCGSGATLNITTEVRVGPLGSGVSRPASMSVFNPYGDKFVLSWRTCR